MKHYIPETNPMRRQYGVRAGYQARHFTCAAIQQPVFGGD